MCESTELVSWALFGALATFAAMFAAIGMKWGRWEREAKALPELKAAEARGYAQACSEHAGAARAAYLRGWRDCAARYGIDEKERGHHG